MPISPENLPSRPTPLQTLVLAIHAKLDVILAAEGRKAPELIFGSVQHDEHANPPRVGWQHVGGHWVQDQTAAPSLGTDASPIPVKRLGVRRALAQVTLWHVTAEHNEHMLDRLAMACDRTSPEGKPFQWAIAKYEFPTESVGELLKNGASAIVVYLPVDLPVPAEYDGESVLTTLDDTQLRAGQEDVLDTTTVGQPEFVLNEWV